MLYYNNFNLIPTKIVGFKNSICRNKTCYKVILFLKIIIIIKMKPKSLEIFIPGPAGRLEAKYYKNPKFGSPIAIVLHPHPQYGGTMNNKIVQLMYNIFQKNGFSVIKVNFRVLVKVMEFLIMVKENYQMQLLLWIGLKDKI